MTFEVGDRVSIREEYRHRYGGNPNGTVMGKNYLCGPQYSVEYRVEFDETNPPGGQRIMHDYELQSTIREDYLSFREKIKDRLL